MSHTPCHVPPLINRFQVRDFLTLSGTRRAPDGWWCAPPEPGAPPVTEAPSDAEDNAFERQQLQLRMAAHAEAAAQAAANRQHRISSSGGGGGSSGGGGGGTAAGRAAHRASEDGGSDHKGKAAGGSTGRDAEEYEAEAADDDDSDFEGEQDRARRRRGGGGRRSAGAGASGAQPRRKRRSSPGGASRRRRSGREAAAAQEEEHEQAHDEGDRVGRSHQDDPQGHVYAVSEDGESLRMAAAAIAEIARAAGSATAPSGAAAVLALAPPQVPLVENALLQPPAVMQLPAAVMPLPAGMQPPAAQRDADNGSGALRPLRAGSSGAVAGAGAAAAAAIDGRTGSWLDRYGSDAVDGPAKGLRNSAAARAAVQQQHAAVKAQEEDLRRYVAAQAAEAAADVDGWAQAYDLDGTECNHEVEEVEELMVYDEEDELVAAVAAAAAIACGGARSAAAALPPANQTWARMVGVPVDSPQWRDAAPRAPAAAEAEAPLTPYYATLFASMAGVAGAVAAVPGAVAVYELPGLSPLQQQQLRSLVLQHHRHGAPPLVAALAAVAAAFPGCCSCLLNAASGRQGAVAEARAALEASFGSPCYGDALWGGAFGGAFGGAKAAHAPRRALLSPARAAGAGAFLDQPAVAAQPASRRRGGSGAAAVELPRTVAGPGVPEHLIAEGPSVRMGDPHGPRFEMLKRNVYVSRERPKRLAKDDVAVCSCRCAAKGWWIIVGLVSGDGWMRSSAWVCAVLGVGRIMEL